MQRSNLCAAWGKYANKDVVNPGSLILSGAMMFDYLGWREAGKRIKKSL